jgi:hypothetical protein
MANGRLRNIPPGGDQQASHPNVRPTFKARQREPAGVRVDRPKK